MREITIPSVLPWRPETTRVKAHSISESKHLVFHRSLDSFSKPAEYVVTHVPTSLKVASLYTADFATARKRAKELAALTDDEGRSVWDFEEVPKDFGAMAAYRKGRSLVNAWEAQQATEKKEKPC
jgi:hypothetical protein